MKKRDAIKFIINVLEARCNMGYSINEILTKEGIENLLFIENKEKPFCDNIEIDIFNYLRSKRCDMREISFAAADIFGLDFTGFTGVKINPCGKDLTLCIFDGVEFTGPFDGARIDTTDFTGSKGAIIDVSALAGHSIANSKMCDVTFVGSFEDADLFMTDFTGSKGAKINPNRLFTDGLEGTVLEGVEFTEPISKCCVDGANFTGSKNSVILADDIESLRDTVLTDAIVIGSLNGKCTRVITDGAIFLGSFVITNEKEVSKKKIRKGKRRYIGKHERRA